MRDSLDILRIDDFVEHHGVKGMKWGVRKQRTPNRAQRIAEKYAVSAAKKVKKKAEKNIRKYEKQQYKLAKPYADKTGHFKITDPAKAEKHFKLSEKIIENKKLIKQIDEALKKGPKEVNKKYSGTSMMNVHAQLAMQAHQTALRNHMMFVDQVAQQNTLQSIQNFHNQMHFDNMNNMQNIHTHNMMF